MESDSFSSFFSVDLPFQIEVGGELVLDTQEERVNAVSDLETIISLFGSSTNLRISGSYLEDPNIIIGNESNPSFSSQPILIEAEDLVLDTYLIEDLDIGGQAISLMDATGEVGTATLNVEDFSIPTGTYDLTLGVFDENDGEAQLEVLLNGELVGEPTILNENTSSGFPVEETRRDIVLENVEIGFSDIITIRGTADLNDMGGGEWARVDYIDFIPSIADS